MILLHIADKCCKCKHIVLLLHKLKAKDLIMRKLKRILSRFFNLIYREMLFEVLIDKILISPSPAWMNDLHFTKHGKIIKYIKTLRLSLFLKKVGINKINSFESNKEIIDKLSKSSIIKSRNASIKFLIIYLHSKGFIKASVEVLNMYIENLLLYDFSKLKNRDLIEISHTIIWGYDIQKFDLLNKAIKLKSIFPKLSEYFKFEVSYLMGHRNKQHNFNNSIDDLFGSYINNKRIAIVGPKISPNDQSVITKEINSFDIVIVPSYNESNFKNSKFNVNISYYNSELQHGLTSNKFGDVTKLDFLVGRGNQMVNYNYKFNFREAHLPKFPWIVGTPNMVPLILHDLMHFSPKTIKVFGIDFFAGQNPYYDGYYYSITNENKVGFAVHNLVANWRYVKHLFTLKYLEIDSMGREILELKQVEYVTKIEQNYYKIY